MKKFLIILTVLTVGCSRSIPNKDLVVYSHDLTNYGYTANMLTAYSSENEIETFVSLSKKAQDICEGYHATAMVVNGKGGMTDSGCHTYTIAFACH